MTWVRLDDGYFRNPKARALGRDGRALHLASLCWCAANLTDGFIRASDLPLLLAEADVKRGVVNTLTRENAWIEVDGGWEIKDFLTYNRAAAHVEHERAEARERMQRTRERRRNTPPSSPDVRPNVQPNIANRSPYPDPTRPDPIVKDLPPPQDCSAAPPGGGGAQNPLDAAITHAVDIEQANAGPLRNPTAWRRKVTERIRGDHAEELARLIAQGATPTRAAQTILGITPPPARTDPAELAARTMVAALTLTGEAPPDVLHQALGSHPHAYDAIIDELHTRTGWTPPDTPTATVTPIRGATHP